MGVKIHTIAAALDLPSAYYEADVRMPLDRVLQYAFNPSIPWFATSPSSLRSTAWTRTEQPWPALPRLWEQIPKGGPPLVVRGEEVVENTPELVSASATAGLQFTGLVATAHPAHRFMVWWLIDALGMLLVAPALLAWFGAFGFLGNVWVSRHIERLGASRTVGIAIGCMVMSMAAWPLGDTLVMAALVMIPWALGCFASNSAQQARLLEMAPALASASIAMNTSAIPPSPIFSSNSYLPANILLPIDDIPPVIVS